MIGGVNILHLKVLIFFKVKSNSCLENQSSDSKPEGKEGEAEAKDGEEDGEEDAEGAEGNQRFTCIPLTNYI